jgi:hypothetical protein
MIRKAFVSLQHLSAAKPDSIIFQRSVACAASYFAADRTAAQLLTQRLSPWRWPLSLALVAMKPATPGSEQASAPSPVFKALK